MIFFIIFAIVEWAALLFLFYLSLIFWLDGVYIAPIVWIVFAISTSYPALFGIAFFLLSKKLATKRRPYFIVAFNIFPVFLFLVLTLLDMLGL